MAGHRHKNSQLTVRPAPRTGRPAHIVRKSWRGVERHRSRCLFVTKTSEQQNVILQNCASMFPGSSAVIFRHPGIVVDCIFTMWTDILSQNQFDRRSSDSKWPPIVFASCRKVAVCQTRRGPSPSSGKYRNQGAI